MIIYNLIYLYLKHIEKRLNFHSLHMLLRYRFLGRLMKYVLYSRLNPLYTALNEKSRRIVHSDNGCENMELYLNVNAHRRKVFVRFARQENSQKVVLPNPYRVKSFLTEVHQAAAIIDTHPAIRNLERDAKKDVLFNPISTNACVGAVAVVCREYDRRGFDCTDVPRSCNIRYFRII